MRWMHGCLGVAAGAWLIAAAAQPTAAQAQASERQMIDRGRYLVHITGCNDCHTAGFAESAGKTPEKDWLTGSPLGFRGPWGTTYASNLRLMVAKSPEDAWVTAVRTAQYRPPMPWFSLHAMTADDVRAMYRFIKSLGPAGQQVPAYVPPGQAPKGPVVTWP